MVKIYLGRQRIAETNSTNYYEVVNAITDRTHLAEQDFYLEHNGRLVTNCTNRLSNDANINCVLRLHGGKGGFGSMLRAIGAQIEKTTNREACRDLSGRRLRDINEEKRLKAWLEKQGEREREAEERKKRKIEKLLAVPKHEFKDEKYEEARSKLTEKVSDAVEEGFKKAEEAKKTEECADKSNLKRKGAVPPASSKSKKKKSALWIGDDISDSDDTTTDLSDNEKDVEATKLKTKIAN